MTANKHDSNFSSKLKLIKYYGLDEFSEALFLVEAESFDSLTDKKNQGESFPKGIIFALGIIATLVVLSVLQLYSVLDVTPSSQKTTKFRDSVTIIR